MNKQTEVEERVRGSLLAGAIGDPFESGFENRKPVFSCDIRSATNLSITDDTQLTLSTCESILNRKAVAPENIAETFRDLYMRKCSTGQPFFFDYLKDRPGELALKS